MTDLDITRLCVEAMGMDYLSPVFALGGGPRIGYAVRTGNRPWNPLHDDAQAMALVKKFDLSISRGGQATSSPWWSVSMQPRGRSIVRNDLNRAICECVAKMQTTKVSA